MSVDFDRLHGMYDHSPVMIAAYDSFDRLRYANQAFRAAYFIEPDEEPFWPDLMRRNHKAGPHRHPKRRLQGLAVLDERA